MPPFEGAFFKKEDDPMDLYLKLSHIISDEDAQGLVDYAIILSLVASVVVGAILLFGNYVLDLYDNIIGKMPGI